MELCFNWRGVGEVGSRLWYPYGTLGRHRVGREGQFVDVMRWGAGGRPHLTGNQ